jgi:hypothetical protein
MREVAVTLDVTTAELIEKVGIIKDRTKLPEHIKLFVAQADGVMDKVRAEVASGEMSADKAFAFLQMLVDCCARVMYHPVVASNHYLTRFAEGVTHAQARHELQQFSVFALQFDVAQAKLVANAPTEEAYEERLRVLLNEKGIPYKDGFEGELTGVWNPNTVHFSWLVKTAEGLDLKFEDLGKIWIGQPGTKQFVKTVFDTYASTDQNLAAGATFAVENWAANRLWTPWIAGMRKLNAGLAKQVHLGYLTYHEAEEKHHSQATLDELLEDFSEPWFDSEKFFQGVETILTDGVQAYYESQLATMPDKDASWPRQAVSPRSFDPASLPRLVFAGARV